MEAQGSGSFRSGGGMLTTLYTFRMIFLVFFGEAQSEVTKRPGNANAHSMLSLAFLSIVSGYVKTPFAPIPGDNPAVDRRGALSPNNRVCFRDHRALVF